MLTFSILGLGEFISLASKLSIEHFKEASSYNNELELDMNWEVYYKYESINLLKIVGAFSGKEFVGYAFVIKVPMLLHKSLVMGMVQFIYLSPEYRKGRNGLELIKVVESVAKLIGCDYITFSISKQQKRVHNLFVNLGYKLREAVFSRKL